VSAKLVDAWRLAARHLAPDRAEELTDRLVAVEEAFWTTTATHQRSATLADLLAATAAELHLDEADGRRAGPPPDAVIATLPELVGLVDGWSRAPGGQATVATPRMP